MMTRRPNTEDEAVALLEERRKSRQSPSDVARFDDWALEDQLREFQHRLALPLVLHCDCHDGTPPDGIPDDIDERVVAIQTAQAFGNGVVWFIEVLKRGLQYEECVRMLGRDRTYQILHERRMSA